MTVRVQASFDMLVLVIRDKEEWGRNQTKLQTLSHTCSTNILESLEQFFFHRMSGRDVKTRLCGVVQRIHSVDTKYQKYTEASVSALYPCCSTMLFNPHLCSPIVCVFYEFLCEIWWKGRFYSVLLGSNFDWVTSSVRHRRNLANNSSGISSLVDGDLRLCSVL